MPASPRGLYEVLITTSIEAALQDVGERQEFRHDSLRETEAADRIAFLAEQVEQGFPFLPAGCHMELDPVAAEIVLRNIRESVPSRWTAKVEELRALARTDGEPSLSRYLEETGLELEDVYDGGRSWSELCADAGIPFPTPGPSEEALRRACGRLLHVDDRTRLEAYGRLIALDQPPHVDQLGVRERRSCAC